MEKDIILEALYRFKEIVDRDRFLLTTPFQTGESDRRLVRLAIKKYNKTMKWRSRIPQYRPNQKKLMT
jgi:hypothetical protein